jgi:hypothetical protein
MISIEPDYHNIEQTKGVSKTNFHVFYDRYFCTEYFIALQLRWHIGSIVCRLNNI